MDGYYFPGARKKGGMWFVPLEEVYKLSQQVKKYGGELPPRKRSRKPTVFVLKSVERIRHEREMAELKRDEARQEIYKKLLKG